MQRQGSADIVIGLAGNKLDLAASGSRKVSVEEAKQYADENGCLYFETSAKTGENVKAIFRAVGESVRAVYDNCSHV